MAFEKKKLTQEEQEYVKKIIIEKKTSIEKKSSGCAKIFVDFAQEEICRYNLLDLVYTIVDTSKNIYLLNENDENWKSKSDVFFIFVWKGFCIKIIIGITEINMIDGIYEPGSYAKYVYIPKKIQKNHIEIMNDLKEALILYKNNSSKYCFLDTYEKLIVSFK